MIVILPYILLLCCGLSHGWCFGRTHILVTQMPACVWLLCCISLDWFIAGAINIRLRVPSAATMDRRSASFLCRNVATYSVADAVCTLQFRVRLTASNLLACLRSRLSILSRSSSLSSRVSLQCSRYSIGKCLSFVFRGSNVMLALVRRR